MCDETRCDLIAAFRKLRIARKFDNSAIKVVLKALGLTTSYFIAAGTIHLKRGRLPVYSGEDELVVSEFQVS